MSIQESKHSAIADANLSDISEIVLKVKSLKTKEVYTLHVSPQSTIQNIKNHIQSITRVTPHSQRLLFKGKLLHSEHCLLYYKLENNSIIHLIERDDSYNTTNRESCGVGATETKNKDHTAVIDNNKIDNISPLDVTQNKSLNVIPKDDSSNQNLSTEISSNVSSNSRNSFNRNNAPMRETSGESTSENFTNTEDVESKENAENINNDRFASMFSNVLDSLSETFHSRNDDGVNEAETSTRGVQTATSQQSFLPDNTRGGERSLSELNLTSTLSTTLESVRPLARLLERGASRVGSLLRQLPSTRNIRSIGRGVIHPHGRRRMNSLNVIPDSNLNIMQRERSDSNSNLNLNSVQRRRREMVHLSDALFDAQLAMHQAQIPMLELSEAVARADLLSDSGRTKVARAAHQLSPVLAQLGGLCSLLSQAVKGIRETASTHSFEENLSTNVATALPVDTSSNHTTNSSTLQSDDNRTGSNKVDHGNNLNNETNRENVNNRNVNVATQSSQTTRTPIVTRHSRTSGNIAAIPTRAARAAAAAQRRRAVQDAAMSAAERMASNMQSRNTPPNPHNVTRNRSLSFTFGTNHTRMPTNQLENAARVLGEQISQLIGNSFGVSSANSEPVGTVSGNNEAASTTSGNSEPFSTISGNHEPAITVETASIATENFQEASPTVLSNDNASHLEEETSSNYNSSSVNTDVTNIDTNTTESTTEEVENKTDESGTTQIESICGSYVEPTVDDELKDGK